MVLIIAIEKAILDIEFLDKFSGTSDTTQNLPVRLGPVSDHFSKTTVSAAAPSSISKAVILLTNSSGPQT